MALGAASESAEESKQTVKAQSAKKNAENRLFFLPKMHFAADTLLFGCIPGVVRGWKNRFCSEVICATSAQAD